jgi:ribulose 1,5-bisphosphate carboxylase large subunit-like protein
MMHAGMVGGYLDEPIELMTQRIKNIQDDYFSLKGIIPSMSCGAHPGLVKYLKKIFGNNIMISSGGAIHAHRDGTFSGTKAFLDAANDLKSKELDVAIEQFGFKE